MKVKDLRVGELYIIKNKKHVVKNVFTKNIKLHPKVHSITKHRNLPRELSYIHVESNGRINKQHPIMYLGSTKENWHLTGIDWQPIRKRHWCMYQGQKVVLDGWAAQHFKKYLGE